MTDILERTTDIEPDQDLIAEADIDPRPHDWDEAMTIQEYVAEWSANACCPDWVTAAQRLCGCGGSGHMPPIVREYFDYDYEGDW